MYVVVEAKRAGQHKFVYCEVLRVRNMRYYFKNNSCFAPVHANCALTDTTYQCQTTRDEDYKQATNVGWRMLQGISAFRSLRPYVDVVHFSV
jgi:hypothetical protein